MIKTLFVYGVVLLITAGCAFSAPPRNVIFLIGDGMGFEQVKAAGIYANGAAGTLSFESLPYQADCTTHSADSGIGYTNWTDSAAAGTALATGHKVDNGVVSLAIPGDGKTEYETLLEYFKARGKDTGLVTTAYISHATPACYGAHETARGNYDEIAEDYLTQTLPNLLMGGAKYLTSSNAIAAGYTVVTDCDSMQALNTGDVDYLAGLFGDEYMPYEYGNQSDYDSGDYPHLTEMTVTALDFLDDDPDGFFLMVEGARIDHAGHSNLLKENIHETIEFANAVQAVMDWAAGRTDTLVIVTADHETGGLTVTETDPTQGDYPDVDWYWGKHTGQNVPVYAIGVNAERIGGTMDNTDFFDICISDEFPADRNEDRVVDFSDFSILADQWQAGTDVDGLKGLADSWLFGRRAEFVLRFDGVDDSIEIEGYKGIAGDDSRTCCAWIRATEPSAIIISWGNGDPGAKWIVRINDTGTLRAEVSGGYIFGATSLCDGSWHHVAVVLDSDGTPDVSEIQLYVDGQLETNLTKSDKLIDTASGQDVAIGAYSGAPLNFKGQIDDVRIYDRALSEAEINSFENIQDGLVAYWNLNEGSGDTASDSVSGYTGTLYGPQWLVDFGKH